MANVVERWRREAETAPSLDALLAQVLSELLKQRMRIGLARGYKPQSRAISGIRGRIDFIQSIKHLEFVRGRAHCRFSEFTVDIPRNQIIRAVLSRLAATGVFGSARPAEDLRQKLRRLVRDLDGITMIEPRLGAIARETLGRNDGDYRLMLAICELALRREMPMEVEGARAGVGLDRDTLTLHRVFEGFVSAFLLIHLVDWEVESQKRLGWHDETSTYLPGMQVDVLLRHRISGRLIMLDTKFTASSLVTGRFGQTTFNSGHLYQIYSYLRSQEHLSPAHRSAQGVVLYPAVGTELSECVTLQGHPVRIETIDLSQPWPHIESRLIAAAVSAY